MANFDGFFASFLQSYLDSYIAKLNSNGSFLWAKQFAGLGSSDVRHAAVDSTGNIYLTGNFSGTVEFDPGGGGTALTSVGLEDMVLAKYDSNGGFVWAKQIGGPDHDDSLDLALDNSGNIYLAGVFSGIIDFNPGSGTINLTSQGSTDVAVSRMDSNGSFVWARQLGGLDRESVSGIVVDGNGDILTTGTFYGTADFDPSVGTFNLISVGDRDIYISKLTQQAPPTPTPTATPLPSPLLNNLVSYWKLDESNGVRADSHGNNNLTDNNTVGVVTGKLVNAASFNSTNSESLSRTDNASLSTGNLGFTVSAWVRHTSTASNMTILGKTGSSGLEYRLYYSASGSHRYRFSVSNGPTTTTAVKSNFIPQVLAFGTLLSHGTMPAMIKSASALTPLHPAAPLIVSAARIPILRLPSGATLLLATFSRAALMKLAFGSGY